MSSGDDEIIEMITTVYDRLSCPDCHSEVSIGRTAKDLDIFFYQATVSHDKTCPALNERECECDDD